MQDQSPGYIRPEQVLHSPGFHHHEVPPGEDDGKYYAIFLSPISIDFSKHTPLYENEQKRERNNAIETTEIETIEGGQ